MTAAVTPPTTTQERAGDRSRRLAIIVGTAAVALAAGWWLLFAGAFGPSGNDMTYRPYEGQQEELLHIDTGLSPGRTVHILRITPRIVEGPEHLADQVSFAVCPSGSVGMVGGDLTTFCPSPRPIEGATLGEGDQVVLAVPIDEARIRIDGFVVTYRSGTRFGHQRTGANFEFIPPR